jgi:S-DNA-T family DNA segregation ATPase FtsK/SpoIIIE
MVTDEDIARIVELYAPRHENLAPQGDYSDFDPDDLGDEGPVAA